jgi:hypothetical protein
MIIYYTPPNPARKEERTPNQTEGIRPIRSFKNRTPRSHLTTHGNRNLLNRLLVTRAHILDLAHDIHALDHFAEDGVFAVQVRRGSGQDEELAAVGVWARVLQ